MIPNSSFSFSSSKVDLILSSIDKSTFSSVNKGFPSSSVVKISWYADFNESNVGLSWVLSWSIVSVIEDERGEVSFVFTTDVIWSLIFSITAVALSNPKHLFQSIELEFIIEFNSSSENPSTTAFEISPDNPVSSNLFLIDVLYSSIVSSTLPSSRYNSTDAYTLSSRLSRAS